MQRIGELNNYFLFFLFFTYIIYKINLFESYLILNNKKASSQMELIQNKK